MYCHWRRCSEPVEQVHRANKTTDEFIQDVMQTFVDPEGDRIVEEMDRAGVDKRHLCRGLGTGEGEPSVESGNKTAPMLTLP